MRSTCVRFLTSDGGRWQVSTGGGTHPVWARNGRELFYRSGDTLMAVPVQTGSGFAAGNPTRCSRSILSWAPGGRSYDVSPDGQRFLMIKAAPVAGAQRVAARSIIVVENWFEELKRLVPTN